MPGVALTDRLQQLVAYREAFLSSFSIFAQASWSFGEPGGASESHPINSLTAYLILVFKLYPRTSPTDTARRDVTNYHQVSVVVSPRETPYEGLPTVFHPSNTFPVSPHDSCIVPSHSETWSVTHSPHSACLTESQSASINDVHLFESHGGCADSLSLYAATWRKTVVLILPHTATRANYMSMASATRLGLLRHFPSSGPATVCLDIGGLAEDTSFFLSPSLPSGCDVVLGLDWMKSHNGFNDWASQSFKFQSNRLRGSYSLPAWQHASDASRMLSTGQSSGEDHSLHASLFFSPQSTAADAHHGGRIWSTAQGVLSALQDAAIGIQERAPGQSDLGGGKMGGTLESGRGHVQVYVNEVVGDNTSISSSRSNPSPVQYTARFSSEYSDELRRRKDVDDKVELKVLLTECIARLERQHTALPSEDSSPALFSMGEQGEDILSLLPQLHAAAAARIPPNGFRARQAAPIEAIEIAPEEAELAILQSRLFDLIERDNKNPSGPARFLPEVFMPIPGTTTGAGSQASQGFLGLKRHRTDVGGIHKRQRVGELDGEDRSGTIVALDREERVPELPS
ncbi:hypothetical protein AURDEDRAFT_125276 [Auricularia subglabra TFB-10046 SS5]|nr:hypothetical protein AURDEDRAFT_125276 [Auricularia subglabra TFB-10046 SS5]